MVNMTYAGRIYQNPLNKNELWINVGWFGYQFSNEDSQVYPDYDIDRLESYVPRQTYNDLIQLFKQERENNKPCINEGCAYVICCCTCGICFLPIMCMKKQYKSAQQRMTHAYQQLDIGGSMEASLQFIKDADLVAATSNPWKDSTGQTLVIKENDDSLSGTVRGPPPGVNIVLKLPNVIPWPTEPTGPVVTAQPLPQTNIPPPVTVSQYQVTPYPPPLNNIPPYPPLLSDAPPPYPMVVQGNVGNKQHMTYASMQNNYCGECGSKNMGTKFCTNCGKLF